MGRGGRRMYVPPQRKRKDELSSILWAHETIDTQFELDAETRQRFRRGYKTSPGKVRVKFPHQAEDGDDAGRFLYVSVKNRAAYCSLELICGTKQEIKLAPLFPVQWAEPDVGFFQHTADDTAEEAARVEAVKRAGTAPDGGDDDLVVLDVETDALPVVEDHYSAHKEQRMPSADVPLRRARGHQLGMWVPGISLLWCGYLFELSENQFDGEVAAGVASGSGSDDEATQEGPARFLRITRQSSMVKSAAKN
jgi:hypothetical protein